MTELETPFVFAPITTDRLTLRLMRADDLDDLHAQQSDPEVVRYQLFEPRTREEVAEKISQWQGDTIAKEGDFIQPAIVVDDRLVGLIYFKLTSVENLTAEIGWALARDAQGKGYAREAASLVLDIAFGALGLHRVYAELDPRNEASVALCLRLGMRHEAHFVEDMMFKGEWADTGVYGTLDREWLARS